MLEKEYFYLTYDIGGKHIHFKHVHNCVNVNVKCSVLFSVKTKIMSLFNIDKVEDERQVKILCIREILPLKPQPRISFMA